MHRGYAQRLELEVPAALRAAVFACLTRARRRRARLSLILQSAACFVSGLMLVPLAQYAGSELYNSGFAEYFSLVFSDRSAAMGSWQELLYSLLESMPSVAILLVVGATTLLLWSLRNALRNGRVAFTALPTTAV